MQKRAYDKSNRTSKIIYPDAKPVEGRPADTMPDKRDLKRDAAKWRQRKSRERRRRAGDVEIVTVEVCPEVRQRLVKYGFMETHEAQSTRAVERVLKSLGRGNWNGRDPFRNPLGRVESTQTVSGLQAKNEILEKHIDMVNANYSWLCLRLADAEKRIAELEVELKKANLARDV
jgi:hypothetical protein